MAVWHIKSGGTRVIASGASTPDDWTDANCFENNLNLNEWWRILRDTAVGGDEIIFYDTADGVTEVVHDLETGNFLSQVNAGVFTLRGRSNDKNQCSIRCLTNSTLMKFKPNSTAGISYILRGLKFKNPVPALTIAAGTYIQAENLCGNVTFDNCSLGNCELGATIDQLQGLVYSDNTTVRTVTYLNTDIENITSSPSWIGGTFWMQSSVNTTVNIEGTVNVRDINIASTSAGIRGGIIGSCTLNITGDVVINNITKDVPTLNFNRPVFFMGTGDISVTGSIDAKNITATGGISGGQVITVFSPFSIENVTADGITITQGTGENSLGCVVVASSSAAIGSTRNVHVKNINGFSGGAVYYSDGASGTVDEVSAENVTLGENGSAVYSGGDGDMFATGITAINCTTTDGAAIFAHNHPASSTRNKTVEFRNVSVTDCVSTNNTGHGIYINNGNTTYTMTSVVENAIIRNGFGSSEIDFNQGPSATHTATVNNSNIEGGIAGINSSASLTTSNITDNLPLFVNQVAGDFRLTVNSPDVGAGVKYWGNGARPGDIVGEPLPDTEIDSGAHQSTFSANHPANL